MASGNTTNSKMASDDHMDMDVEYSSLESAASSLARRTAPPASRLKGVVPQPNGRWGAQIYDRHSRVWLGTFHDEDAAARAYDVAALRFRGRQAVTNHRRPVAAAEETAGSSSTSSELDAVLVFLNDHSEAEIVDMLRKHTYAEELRRGHGGRARPTPAWAREQLFEKAVTPSDVSKLNRLVVPRQQAERHFPPRPRVAGSGAGDDNGVLLNFEDGEGKVWRFRYSFWNSSQSYVLTKGWSRFVREKRLRAGDTVVFSSCTTDGQDKKFFIDYKQNTRAADAAIGAENETAGHVAVKLFGVDIAGGGREG